MKLSSPLAEMKLRSRLSTHVLLFVSVAIMLVAGLFVPMVFGDPVQDIAAGGDFGDVSGEPDGGPAPEDGGGGEPGVLGAPETSAGETLDGGDSAVEGAEPVGSGEGEGAGDTGPAPPPTPGDPGPSGGGGEELSATDRGVTADSIKVGIMLLNVANASTFGVNIPGASPEEQRVAWDAWIGETNDNGGIFGRKIEPFFKEYDVLSEQSMQEACLAATQDQKVFMVIDAGGLSYTAGLCITRDNQTPYYSLGNSGIPKGGFQEARGLMFTTFSSGVRSISNLVGELEAMGRLEGRSIGLLTTDRPGASATIDEGAVKVLSGYGHEVTHRVDLSEDIQTASSQIPLAVQQMQQAGVDTVLFLTSGLNATQFVNNANTRRYLPKYYVSDWEGGYSDTWVENMPQGTDILLLTTNRTGEFRQNRPEPAPDRRCRELYERRSGQQLDRSTINYSFSLRGCMLWDIFVASANRVGPDLTRPNLAAATQQLGEVPMPTFGGGGFAPGKFDAANLYRTARFERNCGEGGGSGRGCWMPVDEFRKGRF